MNIKTSILHEDNILYLINENKLIREKLLFYKEEFINIKDKNKSLIDSNIEIEKIKNINNNLLYQNRYLLLINFFLVVSNTYLIVYY